MSTNFYYETSEPPIPECEGCGRPLETPYTLHLGKRANGWKFNLWARSREDTWQKIRERLATASRIYDEYDREYSPEQAVALVEEWQDGRAHCDDYPEHSWRDPEGYVMNEREFS